MPKEDCPAEIKRGGCMQRPKKKGLVDQRVVLLFLKGDKKKKKREKYRGQGKKD